MRTAVDFLRRYFGFVRRPAVITPGSERVRVFTPAPFPVSAGVTDERDAALPVEKQDEPAMAGIPEDAVQMTPPMAPSPGLPPVDPVSTAEIEHREDSAAEPKATRARKRSPSAHKKPTSQVAGGKSRRVAVGNPS